MSTPTDTPNLCKAMAKAFPKIEGALKKSENPHFRSKYADFAAVVEAVKPALAECGLFFVQHIRQVVGAAAVETVIYHESGEQLSCGITAVPISKNDAQGYGSALSYARRYGLSSALGVAPEDVGAPKDDDGNAACGKAPKEAAISVAPMSKEEVARFAKELAEKTRDAGYGVDEAKLLAYLVYFQAKRPERDLRSTFEAEVQKNPDVFAEVVDSWVQKSATKAMKAA